MIELIGILFTVMFGIPSLITLWKVYSKSVSFCEVDKLNLHDAVTKNIEDLVITYKNEEISEHLFLYKGFFYCEGKSDITKQDILENFKIQLPNNSKWLECNIIEASDDFKPKLEVDGDTVKFNFELFKHREFFYFEGLFESPESRANKNLIKIKHRIANLGKVDQIDYKKLLEIPSDIIISLIISLGAFIMFYFMLLGTLFSEIELVDIDGNSLKEELVTLNSYEIKSSIEEEYSFFDLFPSKLTKEYKLRFMDSDEPILVKGKLEKGFEFYLRLIFLCMAVFTMLFSFISFLKYISKKGIIKKLDEIGYKKLKG
ncbi:MAG: hypothetical protein AAGA77_22350 [Bacteroidota bacterium]